ncbi:MAG: hypothetical protein NMNS01_26550 [Nitrosomonas sp.]|nr:MAG: hypothetical protein NMNS01_26550 [Nitrosomonas sp.]
MNEIAKQVGFSHYDNISVSIVKFDQRVKEDPQFRDVNQQPEFTTYQHAKISSKNY